MMKASKLIARLLQRKDVVFVANSETKREYYNHLESLKKELAKMRIHPQSFGLLRALMPKLRTVLDENHSFEFAGEPIGRKDYHLLNSAKVRCVDV